MSETQTMKASEVRQQWSETLNKVAKTKTRVIVEKSGVPVAALISTDELARYERIDREQRERFRLLLERMHAPFAALPEEQIMEDVARVIEEVREEMRQEKGGAEQK